MYGTPHINISITSSPQIVSLYHHSVITAAVHLFIVYFIYFYLEKNISFHILLIQVLVRNSFNISIATQLIAHAQTQTVQTQNH